MTLNIKNVTGLQFSWQAWYSPLFVKVRLICVLDSDDDFLKWIDDQGCRFWPHSLRYFFSLSVLPDFRTNHSELSLTVSCLTSKESISWYIAKHWRGQYPGSSYTAYSCKIGFSYFWAMRAAFIALWTSCYFLSWFCPQNSHADGSF